MVWCPSWGRCDANQVAYRVSDHSDTPIWHTPAGTAKGDNSSHQTALLRELRLFSSMWKRITSLIVFSALLTLAIWGVLAGWQHISNRSVAAAPPPALTHEVQSVAAVSGTPPTSTQPPSGDRLAVVPTSSTTFLDEASQGAFSVLSLNTGSNVASGVESATSSPAIKVSQLTQEQAESLTSTAESIGTPLEIVDPVRAWNASMELTPATPVGSPPPSWAGFAVAGVLLAFAGAVMVVLSRRRISGNHGKSFGAQVQVGKAENKGKDRGAYVPPTRFADVAGCDEAVEDLREIVDFLKQPEIFQKVKAEIPRGAILAGPPGTGKTLLARAVAGEAGVPFYAVSGSDFTERYVGVGAQRVRSLFKKARKHKEGAIIFIDEVDAVGRARGSTVNAHPEQENTLNALLVEMDGFHQDKIIILAASNRVDMLDPALRRPGRLERQVEVPLPDRRGRERILAIHAKSRPIGPDVDYSHLARRTPGMSGAELARIINEACIHAARAGRNVVSAFDFDQAIETVALGKARHSALVTERDRTITAWHEAGHAVSALLCPDSDPPVSVSIIPRGPAGGVTWTSKGDDIFLTRRQAHGRLLVAMSGRAAEEILLNGEFTSGPHGDLTSATALALAMVTQYGMTDAGLMVRNDNILATGGQVAADTVAAVEELLSKSLDEARKLLRDNHALLQKVAEELLDRDTLTGTDLAELAQSLGYRPST